MHYPGSLLSWLPRHALYLHSTAKVFLSPVIFSAIGWKKTKTTVSCLSVHSWFPSAGILEMQMNISIFKCANPLFKKKKVKSIQMKAVTKQGQSICLAQQRAEKMSSQQACWVKACPDNVPWRKKAQQGILNKKQLMWFLIIFQLLFKYFWSSQTWFPVFMKNTVLKSTASLLSIFIHCFKNLCGIFH